MKSNTLKAWSIGLLILLLFAVLGEAVVAFHDYTFGRIGIAKNTILYILWVLPLAAAFIATYMAESKKIIVGLSYLVLFPLLAALIHYLHGELGGTVDFGGVKGAVFVFKLYFYIGSALTILGTILGLLLSKSKEKQQ